MSEERLLRDLEGVLADADPVPEEARLAARSAIAWRAMDALVLQLTADSLEAAEAGVRDPGATRLVSFADGERSLRMEVLDEGGGRALRGALDPPGPASVRVHQPGGEARGEVDPDGRFHVGGLAGGPVSVVVEPGGPAWTRPVRTGWLAI